MRLLVDFPCSFPLYLNTFTFVSYLKSTEGFKEHPANVIKSKDLLYEDHRHLRCCTSSTFLRTWRIPDAVHNAQHHNRSPGFRIPHEPKSSLSTTLFSASGKAKKNKLTNQHLSIGKTAPTSKHLLHVAKGSLSERPSFFGQKLRGRLGWFAILGKLCDVRLLYGKNGIRDFQQVVVSNGGGKVLKMRADMKV